MLVAAILIGITYSVYSVISKSYISFNRKSEEMAIQLQLDKSLKKDFNQAEIIFKDTRGISFKSAEHAVTYIFEPDYIIRSEFNTDTFKVKAETMNTMFERKTINEVSLDEEQNKLDEFKLVILFKNEKIPYHYYKLYSSVNLIKRKPNALN